MRKMPLFCVILSTCLACTLISIYQPYQKVSLVTLWHILSNRRRYRQTWNFCFVADRTIIQHDDNFLGSVDYKECVEIDQQSAPRGYEKNKITLTLRNVVFLLCVPTRVPHFPTPRVLTARPENDLPDVCVSIKFTESLILNDGNLLHEIF